VSVTEEYFLYDGLSLMGEVGGYRGLFLGMSLYHLALAGAKWAGKYF